MASAIKWLHSMWLTLTDHWDGSILRSGNALATAMSRLAHARWYTVRSLNPTFTATSFNSVAVWPQLVIHVCVDFKVIAK